MSKWLLFVLLFNSSLFAKTGPFILVGGQLVNSMASNHVSKEKSINVPVSYSTGYIYDFNQFIGMGFEGGYSNFCKRNYYNHDKSKAKAWSIELLWDPVVLNVFNFRMMAKIGNLRFITEKGRLTTSAVNVYGVSLEAFLNESISIIGLYLNNFQFEQRKKNIVIGRKELALRYTFPIS